MSRDFSALIGEGFLNNILIMLLSSLLPAIVGIGLTFLVGMVKKKGLRIPLRIIGAVFYSLAPMPLMLYLFFNPFSHSIVRIISVVLALSISHLGYYMMCYDASASIGKNIAVNSLGLLSSTFLWSMVSSFIGQSDIISACRVITGSTYQYECYGIVLLICFVVLAILNIPRMILKEVIK